MIVIYYMLQYDRMLRMVLLNIISMFFNPSPKFFVCFIVCPTYFNTSFQFYKISYKLHYFYKEDDLCLYALLQTDLTY